VLCSPILLRPPPESFIVTGQPALRRLVFRLARIVEKQGGALEYETEVNRGTTFGIALPRVEKNENEVQDSTD
jgi:hypothetical protein